MCLEPIDDVVNSALKNEEIKSFADISRKQEADKSSDALPVAHQPKLIAPDAVVNEPINPAANSAATKGKILRRKHAASSSKSVPTVIMEPDNSSYQKSPEKCCASKESVILKEELSTTKHYNEIQVFLASQKL